MSSFAVREKRLAVAGARQKSVPACATMTPDYRPIPFHHLPGWQEDEALAAFDVFKAGAERLVAALRPLRHAREPSAALVQIGKAALCAKPRDHAEARAFFEAHFTPFEIFPEAPAKNPARPFFTAYFEPTTEGSLERGGRFQAPILARPADLVTLPEPERLDSCDLLLTSARRVGKRHLPYPDRGAIESGALSDQGLELVWLEDCVEVFIVQVQGSARVTLTDGRKIRLRYDGRNGWPYTSVGRPLIEEGAIAEGEMSLEALTGWLRAHPEKAAPLIRRNRSYVFFAIEEELREHEGPIGGAGLPLTAGRSLAIDRDLWSYGLPFWMDVERPLPSSEWGRWQRLMIAQDTGTAIVGRGRIDLFVGAGPEAGQLAGRQRHHGRLFVLSPRGEAPPRQ
ncbi:MAG: MltA domain-containing protein [Hyphomicrobiales bacterium]|nr:MltA domain-containing protein [Hyphomicrobiales bacterium]